MSSGDSDGDADNSPTKKGRIGKGCSAVWCNRRPDTRRRISGLLQTTRAKACTDKATAKARAKKTERDRQLVCIGRGDIVAAEKNDVFGKHTDQRGSKDPCRDVRVCTIHPDPTKPYPGGYPLVTDPVIKGEVDGYDEAKVTAGSAVAAARIKAIEQGSPDAQQRRQRKRRRDGSDLDEAVALRAKVRALEEQLAELKRDSIPRVSWENVQKHLLPDRPMFTIPERNLRTWMDMMYAVNLPTCWSEHFKADEKRFSKIAHNLGFEDACILLAMMSSTGCSQAQAAWASGLSSDHGLKHGQVLVGAIYRGTIHVVCYHYSMTVAQHPHLSQLDRDARPAFNTTGVDGDSMEDNLLTLDASNVSIEGKIKNPVGDGASYSAYYSANCGKYEVCSDKAGNPAWVSLVFGGGASEKKIVCYEDNFEEWFGGFQTAMLGQAGQEFTIGMLADKGGLR